MIISDKDLHFLLDLGDTDSGFVARGEVAEMYDVPADDIDDLVLSRIYSDDDK